MTSSALPLIGTVKLFDPLGSLLCQKMRRHPATFGFSFPVWCLLLALEAQEKLLQSISPVPVLCLLSLASLHFSHLSELFALSQTVKIKLPNLKLTFLSELVLGSSQLCLQLTLRILI